MKYYIIAGEASGDLHASNLMRGLLQCDPSCDIRFWGGDAMAAVGGTLVRHYRDTAVMGIAEVVAKAGKVLANLRFCKQDILDYRPDVLILVDYPGFNMKIAEFARKEGLHTVWYIAPKVWAHKSRRVKALKRDVDELYTIFPFELAWFREHGVEPRWEGNPLLDSLARTQFRPLDASPAKGRMIALLPGSRDMELKYLMPRFVELEKMLSADGRFADCRLTIAGAPAMKMGDYSKYLPSGSRMEVVFGRTYDILHEADAAVISSGTASLEAALLDVPQVVCYGVNPLTYMLVKPTLKVKYISLANLSLDKPIFPELIQNDAAPERIFRELERILTDEGVRARMRSDYALLRSTLGGPGASYRIAKDIYETARI